jgi:hypothetical protein
MAQIFALLVVFVPLWIFASWALDCLEYGFRQPKPNRSEPRAVMGPRTAEGESTGDGALSVQASQ